jgi:alpha-L-fucosidase
MRRDITGMTGWLSLLLTSAVALSACGWRDSVLTLRADAGGSAPDTGGLILEECPIAPGAPSAVAPTPTPAQVALQRTELTAYLHFGLNTFDGTEYGNPALDTPSLFSPTNLDATEWVTALKAAGFRQAKLIVKHTTGFCLWPSAYTDYSVKNSPWKNGQGDVVRDFADAMHAAGMRVAFYLSPLDDHYPSSSSDYETYFRNQLTELLTNYGPVYEIEFNGYQAPTSLDWTGIAELAHRLQPGILVYTGGQIATTGADVRYLGTQSGQASRATSSIADVPNGGPSNVWYPALGPLSDRGLNTWFWHPNNSVISLETLEAAYFATVGMNTTLILNVPPADTGQFDTPDVDLLGQFAAWYGALYATNLLQGAPVSADSIWTNPGFEASKAVDGDLCTYWAAAAGRTAGRLEVTPPGGLTFGRISIREPIELGERTTAYHLELKQNGTWNKSPTDISGATVAGTVIGQRQLWQLPPTTAEAVALVVDAAKDVPAIAELGLY